MYRICDSDEQINARAGQRRDLNNQGRFYGRGKKSARKSLIFLLLESRVNSSRGSLASILGPIYFSATGAQEWVTPNASLLSVGKSV